MTENKKMNDFKNIIKYLKQYGGKVRNLNDIIKIKNEIINNHTLIDLKSIQLLLKTEIEDKKHHGPTLNAYNLLVNPTITFFIAFIVFGTNFLTNWTNLVVNKSFEIYGDKIKEEQVEDSLKLLEEVNNIISPVLFNFWKLSFFGILFIVLIISLFILKRFSKDYKLLQFYHNLIDECIMEKNKINEMNEKEENDEVIEEEILISEET